MPTASNGTTVRIAAIADLHFGRDSDASSVPALLQACDSADVLLLCGDLTHHGLVEEALDLAKALSKIQVPILAVLGNHDFHSEQQNEIRRALKDTPIRLLDGESAQVRGVGFAGVKGFASGFGRRMLEPWGETVVKQFVREAVEESLKLGSALAQLATDPRVVLLHYSPILETVEGEPTEIYPFLGSSHLEEPINRFQVAAVFHGHAHHGRAEGRTATGIPVYNVSMPLLKRTRPDACPVRIIEIEARKPSPGPNVP
jgi:Icc-related predicted phosphoesterase